MKKITLLFSISLALASCNNNDFKYDAAGTFEAVEVTVAAEANGKIMQFNLEEGDTISTSFAIGYIDTMQLYLKKLQLRQSVLSTEGRKSDITKQIAATREQIANAKVEKARTERLIAANAAGTKQLDDINTQLAVLESQLAAQLSSLGRGNQSLSDEARAQIAQIEQIQDQIQKSYITSPITGTVLTKYVESGEYAATGKPLFSIANIDTLNLRAYVTSDQLSQISLGQSVKVFADYGEKDNKEYSGRIIWIADKAEFTPKTIQTRDERANLVYAVKIAVKNDGYIKIGMYGDVIF